MSETLYFDIFNSISLKNKFKNSPFCELTFRFMLLLQTLLYRDPL